MHRSYHDIISRIAEPPLWWQEGGIPRYDEFDPDRSTGIYTSGVALAEIACQMTGLRFFVVFEGRKDRSIAAAIRNSSLEYGDPPNVDGVSAFTSSDTIRVVQYWYKNHPEFVTNGVITDRRYREWRRDRSLEVTFPDAEPIGIPVYWNPSPPDGKPSPRTLSRALFSVSRWWKRVWPG